MVRKTMTMMLVATLLGGTAIPTMALARGGGGGHGGGGHGGGGHFGGGHFGGGHFAGGHFGGFHAGGTHVGVGGTRVHVGGTRVARDDGFRHYGRVGGRGFRGYGYWGDDYASCYPYSGVYPDCNWPQ